VRTITRVLLSATLIAVAALFLLEPVRIGVGYVALAATPGYEDRFRDYVPFTGMHDTVAVWSPTRTASGAETYFPVNSKWQQPRDTGTTPHQGVDLAAGMGTPVHPIDRGWIVFQAEANGGADEYELIIRLDWDYDGLQNDDVYVKYDHLQYVGYWPTGALVYPSDQVATSGNEGGHQSVHLHFGTLYPKFSGSNTGRWTGMERLYTGVTAWNYGRDLDFICFLDVIGNSVWANAYTMNMGAHQALPPGNVRLFHRRPGASAYDSAQMSAASGDDWFVDLNALGYVAGDNVEWLVRARRPLGTEFHNSAYFPPQFRHPDNSPNDTPTRFPFYTTQVF
jgi:murein DD-endopeptidase MepM/ murein hydrolase activator NlpD